MSADPTIRAMLVLCTGILVLAALYFTRSILAPVAFSLFIIAVVWPLQSALQAKIPKLLALAVTILAILATIAVLAFLVVWGFSRIGQWLINNVGRFQMLYAQAIDWLDGHGVSIVSQMTENFNVSWLFRAVQELGRQISVLASFAVITFVYTALGLLEVDIARKNIERLESKEIGQSLLRASADIAAKLQMYMLVRSAMSILTGSVVWGFALLAGLELATAWGVIAFVLNYVPFIGPLVATVFPTLFAIAQFESWQLAVIVFVCLNLIQFLIGSYFEPRIAGAALSVSPFLVLFAIFFWSFLWGIAGAFIGVPIVIAFLAICEHQESTQWVATLFSGRDSAPAQPRS
jgi:predicted PurR-regulated permease PerM